MIRIKLCLFFFCCSFKLCPHFFLSVLVRRAEIRDKLRLLFCCVMRGVCGRFLFIVCVEFCIFVVRRLLAGDWLAPKTLSKFRKICLVVPLVVGSVLCCPQKLLLYRLLENFTLDN